jgi:hypothetical protein
MRPRPRLVAESFLSSRVLLNTCEISSHCCSHPL